MKKIAIVIAISIFAMSCEDPSEGIMMKQVSSSFAIETSTVYKWISTNTIENGSIVKQISGDNFQEYAYFTQDSVYTWNEVDEMSAEVYTYRNDSLLVGHEVINKALVVSINNGFSATIYRENQQYESKYIKDSSIKLGELK